MECRRDILFEAIGEEETFVERIIERALVVLESVAEA